jgi:hypothetical protein
VESFPSALVFKSGFPENTDDRPYLRGENGYAFGTGARDALPSHRARMICSGVVGEKNPTEWA